MMRSLVPGVLSVVVLAGSAHGAQQPGQQARPSSPKAPSPAPGPSTPQRPDRSAAAPSPAARRPAPSGPIGPGRLPPRRAEAERKAGRIELQREVTVRFFVRGKLERGIRKVVAESFPQVLEVRYDEEEREARIKFEGTYRALGDLEKTLKSRFSMVALVDPARLVYRYACPPAERKEFFGALDRLDGVKKVISGGDRLEIFVDLDAFDEEAARAVAKGFRARIDLVSHAWFVLEIRKRAEKVDVEALKKALRRTRGIVHVEIGSEAVRILSLKGAVSRGSLRMVLRRYGIVAR